MNILISTTTNWNPGDDFIRFGVQNLLKGVFNNPTYIHYDRNPDIVNLQKQTSNVMNADIKWDMIDLVVMAGSPEFLHEPLKHIYDGLYEHRHIPLLAIGVGYAFPSNNIVLTEKEKTVLSRDNTFIITRQYDLKDTLAGLLNKEIHTLPCPALFANDEMICMPYIERPLIIRQIHTGLHAIKIEDLVEMDNIVNKEKQYSVCSYCVDEFKVYKGYYNPDVKELLKYICSHKRVITNRLHGGIVALGKSSEVTFINSSYRIIKALEPFNQYEIAPYTYKLSVSDYLNISDTYQNLLERFKKENFNDRD